MNATKNENDTHSAGSWKVGRCNTYEHAIWAEDEQGESVLIAASIGPHFLPQEIAPNARLMAAAPDMLEALRLVDPMGDLSIARDIKGALATQAERDAFDRIIAAVRAAIARATGGRE